MEKDTYSQNIADNVIDIKQYQRITFFCLLFLIFVMAIMYGRFDEDVQNRYQITRSMVNEATFLAGGELSNSEMVGKAAFAKGTAAFIINPSGAIMFRAGNYSRFAQAPTEYLALKASKYTLLNANLNLGKLYSYVAWQKTENGNILLIAALARDAFNRPPVWISYFIFTFATIILIFSLLLALFKQVSSSSELEKENTAHNYLRKIYDQASIFAVEFDPLSLKFFINANINDNYGIIENILTHEDTVFEENQYIIPEDAFIDIFEENTKNRFIDFINNSNLGENEITEELFSITLADGRLKRFLCRVFYDTSSQFKKRKIIFIELDKVTHQRARLIAKTKRLTDILENISDPIIIWGKSGRLEAWNPNFLQLLQLDKDESLFQGMTFSHLSKKINTDNNKQLNAISPLDINHDNKIRNNKIISINQRYYMCNSQLSYQGATIINLYDVTEFITSLSQKQATILQVEEEYALQTKELISLREKSKLFVQEKQKASQEKQKAIEASATKSEFLANMSHELRTPLNAINGFSEIMLSELYGPLGDIKYKEYIFDIKQSGQRLLKLIDDILDISKIQSGNLHIEPVKTNISKVIQEAITYNQLQANNQGIDLKGQFDDVINAWADPKALRNVCNNLISNSLKFTPKGGAILVSTQITLNSLTINIIDSGHGISKENLQKLGKPFEILENSESKFPSGSGLGLALSTSIINKMNGMLAITSKINKGTICSIVIPRRQNSIIEQPTFLEDGFSVILTSNTNNDNDNDNDHDQNDYKELISNFS